MFPLAKERRRQLARSPSNGEMQMFALGRGLMDEAKLILLDGVMGIVPHLKPEGRTIILVGQNTDKAKVADHIYLVRGGKVILSEAVTKIDIDRQYDLYFAREASVEPAIA